MASSACSIAMERRLLNLNMSSFGQSYVYVDDLRTMPVIAQLDGKLGLILPDGKGTIVAPFIYSSITLRDEPPYFEAKKGRKKILLDTDGKEYTA